MSNAKFKILFRTFGVGIVIVLCLCTVLPECSFEEAQVAEHGKSEILGEFLYASLQSDIIAGIFQIFICEVHHSPAVCAGGVKLWRVHVEHMVYENHISVLAHEVVIFIASVKASYTDVVCFLCISKRRSLHFFDYNVATTYASIHIVVATATRRHGCKLPVGEATCALVVGQCLEVEATGGLPASVTIEILIVTVYLKLAVVGIVPILRAVDD